MTRPKLSFEHIEIRRMPGFERGGLVVPVLCPGVNIIYGPNGSGKTTLSKAIERLLAPDHGREPGVHLLGRLEIDGAPYSIRYDSGRVTCQRDGQDVTPPPLAPAGIENRYVLALHDLIHADGGDLAAEIVKESAGGYDIAQARRDVGGRDGPSIKRKLIRQLEEASQARKKAADRQFMLVDQEAELVRLERRREASLEGADELHWLDKASAYLDAQKAKAEAQARVAAFPEGVGRLLGDEVKRLAALRETQERAVERRDEEHRAGERAGEVLAASPLPTEGVAPELVGALRQKCAHLQRLLAQREAKQAELAGASNEREQAQRSLRPGVRVDAAERLDAEAIDGLFRFARRAEELRQSKQAIDQLRPWLETERSDDDVETLGEGVQLLERWLAAEQTAARARRMPMGKLFGVAGVLVVISVVMTVAVHWSWLAVAVLVLGGAAALYFWPTAEDDRAAEIHRQFGSLRIDGPESWSADAVRSHIHQVRRSHAEATVAREKAARWNDIEPRIAELAERQRQLHEERQGWIERLGIDHDPDEAQLYLLASGIRRLQEAEAKLAGAREATAEVERQFDEVLDEINADLQQVGLAVANDPETATAIVEQLDQLARRHADAQASQVDSAARCDELEAEIQTAGQKIEALFADVGLTRDDESTLHQWAAMFEEYCTAGEELRHAERSLASARAALEGRESLLSLSRLELEDERRRCRELAGELEAVGRQIGGIQQAICSAKQEHDLEKALAEEQDVADQLRKQRDDDYRAVLAGVLADYVAREQRDREQPGVFHEARKLFVDITHGRYRLHIDAGDPPQFRAFDTDRQVGLKLEELSAGTRLQLLLAARVAFVEHQEQRSGWKLPLVLDEALANSDDLRSDLMIDASIGIARKGRQVFYLTAQQDEVFKWQNMLDRYDDLECEVIDLAELRGFSPQERIARTAYLPPAPPDVPEPGGMDWLQYGAALEAPPLDPRGEPEGVHLWYLIDDLPTLYRLLKTSVNKWGQLLTLAKYGHADAMGCDDPVYRRAEAAAGVIAAARKHWLVGRGRAVDRDALLASGAVSEVFIDRVAELAAELDGDARRLLVYLDDGQVNGFRKNKLSELRDFLVDHGYFDQNEILSADQIRDQVRLQVLPVIEKGWVSAERFEYLVGLFAGYETPHAPRPAAR